MREEEEGGRGGCPIRLFFHPLLQKSGGGKRFKRKRKWEGKKREEMLRTLARWRTREKRKKIRCPEERKEGGRKKERDVALEHTTRSIS